MAGHERVLGCLLPLWLVLGATGHAQPAMICPGGAIPLDISAASKPFVRMRLGEHEGNFLIDTGATRTHVDAGLYGVAPGSRIALQGSSLPTLAGGTFWAVDLSSQSPFAPHGGFAGAIGTDILSTRTVEFHYEAPRPYLVLSTQLCDPQLFEDAGFVAIAQQGYGASDAWRTWVASRVAPETEIARRSNLPIIYARIGAVIAPFWLDTGLGDRTARQLTLHVNGAILSQLRDADVAMRRAGSVISSDCQGHRTSNALFRVDDAPIVFTTAEGKTLFAYDVPLLQLRGKTPCGTIGNWGEPIGTVGTLFLPRWGTVVFDGPNKRVWVRRSATVAWSGEGARPRETLNEAARN
ncbi:MAG: hypothetical protein JO000_11060 [Alphaproteobacteria bacterium]|nr:hypothetical protein [Alphaproteobacteria bacterium]